MKYLNPVYQALVRNGFRDLAFKWYQANKDFYHPVAAAKIRKMLLQECNPADDALIEEEEKKFLMTKSLTY